MGERESGTAMWLGFLAVMFAFGYVCGGIGTTPRPEPPATTQLLVFLPAEPVGHPGMTRDEVESLIETDVRAILGATDEPCVEASRRLIRLRRGVADGREAQRLADEAYRLHYACVMRTTETVEHEADAADDATGALLECHVALDECREVFAAALGRTERHDAPSRAFPPMTVPTSPDSI